MRLHSFLALILTLGISLSALAEGSFVMLQYHHVSDSTPRSTTVTVKELQSHIDWLKKNRFDIKPLDVAIKELKQGKYQNTDRIAVITIDDSYATFCDNGWPLLKEQNIPFTLFVTTTPVKERHGSQCTMDQLKAMAKSDLAILANHSKTHPHMTDTSEFASKDEWRKFIYEEISGAQDFLDKHFGPQPKLFAYPYGEYNQEIQAIVEELGFIGLGQQSGAVGRHSDFLGLPRFPLSGRYADLKTIPDKLLSLGFPAEFTVSSDNPVTRDSDQNPPTLTLQLKEELPGWVNCFLGTGKPVEIKRSGQDIIVRHSEPLGTGRQRYNCTAASGISGRFYWFSYQFLME